MGRPKKTIKKEAPVEPVDEIIEEAVEDVIAEESAEEVVEVTPEEVEEEVAEESPFEPEYSELGPAVVMNCNVNHDNKNYEAGKTYELDRKTIKLFSEKGFLTT